jgi:hypothetical protein
MAGPEFYMVIADNEDDAYARYPHGVPFDPKVVERAIESKRVAIIIAKPLPTPPPTQIDAIANELDDVEDEFKRSIDLFVVVQSGYDYLEEDYRYAITDSTSRIGAGKGYRNLNEILSVLRRIYKYYEPVERW